MTDPVASRDAAKAAERERLARARARRQSQSSQSSAAVSGFAQRKWRWLGVGGDEAVEAVRAMLADLVAVPELPETDRAVLALALEGTPDREGLLPSVRTGLISLPPDAVLHHLRGLWAAGVRWLNEAGLDRCRLLCSTAPGLELVSTRSRAVSGGPAFSLFTTAATRGAIPLPNRFLDSALSWAPLSVIDDLVDHGGLLAEDSPWEARDAEEALYLRARLAPDGITQQEAERLGWEFWLRRQAFLAGRTVVRQEPDDVWDLLYDVAVEGDVSALDALDAALPRQQQIELRDLKSGAISGQWAQDMAKDRGLWLLMAALWHPQESVDASRGPFYALVAIKRAYDLLKADRLEDAFRQARSLTRAGTGARGVSAELASEANSILAYTTAVKGQLEAAEEYAVRAASGGGTTAEHNLALVRTWSTLTKNERGPVTNPFLEFGLDHGATGWEVHCREIFRQHEGDTPAQARLNRAEDRIRNALHGDAGWKVFFELPLDPSRYVITPGVPRHLVPPLVALTRRTSVTSGAELEAIRARAAVELLDDFRTTAPHLDRHSPVQ
ncbi:hypothetical protein OG625_12285 [Streptomyces sp. NBC_01351]|uniref:hypothetical protein n=1 Tax=Streptomyces sp. NBC_01351 TaxID=2903833 RepID=UPI002E366C80|nr:hypothetical protein [Streptomyces sp. NBC_01351]